jgi:hypothetical protein
MNEHCYVSVSRKLVSDDTCSLLRAGLLCASQLNSCVAPHLTLCYWLVEFCGTVEILCGAIDFDMMSASLFVGLLSDIYRI